MNITMTKFLIRRNDKPFCSVVARDEFSAINKVTGLHKNERLTGRKYKLKDKVESANPLADPQTIFEVEFIEFVK